LDVTDPADMDGALCREYPDLWFAPGVEDRRRAAAVCRSCPWLVGCGDWAVEHRVTAGVWGGMDPLQLAALRRRRDRAARRGDVMHV